MTIIEIVQWALIVLLGLGFCAQLGFNRCVRTLLRDLMERTEIRLKR